MNRHRVDITLGVFLFIPGGRGSGASNKKGRRTNKLSIGRDIMHAGLAVGGQVGSTAITGGIINAICDGSTVRQEKSVLLFTGAEMLEDTKLDVNALPLHRNYPDGVHANGTGSEGSLMRSAPDHTGAAATDHADDRREQTSHRSPSNHNGTDHTTRKPSREELIMHHQKLVHYVAARFVGSGETLEDLIQVGNIGLINALDRYDPSKDVKFSTYAMPTIVGEIKRHFRDKTWQVKVPRWLQELSINARKSQQSLTLKFGRSPSIKEIADAIGATEDRTIEALEITRAASTVSLDTRLDTAGGDSATLMDMIGRPDRELSDIDAYSDLRRAIGLLELRERQVIEMRFFDDLSQAKIARELNISQMHVSRLQQRALLRLRGLLADEAVIAKRRRRSSVRRPSSP